MTAPVGLTSSSQLSSSIHLARANEIKPPHILLTRFPTELFYQLFEKTVKLDDPAFKDLKHNALKAINTYESVLNIQKSPTLLALRGEVHRLKNAWKEAFSDFDTAVKRIPNWYYPLARRGAVLFEMDNDESALEDLTRANAMKPDDAFILSYLGECYRGKRDYETAISYYTEALKIDPKNFRALSGRTECHVALQNHKDAEVDCKNALEIDPEDNFTLSQMAQICLANRNWGLAHEYLNKALQTPLFSVRDFKERALLHLGRGNLKAAFADFDRALYYANKRLEQNPNLVYNWEKRAALYRELNLPEHAASDIHKASQLSPNDPYIKQFHYTPSYVSRYFLQFSPFQAYTEALRKKLGPPTHQAPQAPA